MRSALTKGGMALLLVALGYVVVQSLGPAPYTDTDYARMGEVARRADSLGLGAFHDSTRPSTGSIARLAPYYYDAKHNDAQRLRRSCGSWLGNCRMDYDTDAPVVVYVLNDADKPLADFQTARRVAGLETDPGTTLEEWGIGGASEYFLELKARKPGNADDPTFEAYITDASGARKEDLSVRFVPANGAPKTAAFFWYSKNRFWQNSSPLIGVRCSSAGWCFVGTDERLPRWSGMDERCTDDAGQHCASLFGLHDEQPLARVKGGSNPPVTEVSPSWGLAIPHPALATLPDDWFVRNPDTYQSMAYLRISGAGYKALPADTEVLVEVKRETSGQWWARLSWGSSERLLRINPPDTGESIPAVRWKWESNDEGIWVRCGAGCCEIDIPLQ